MILFLSVMVLFLVVACYVLTAIVDQLAFRVAQLEYDADSK